MANDARSSGKNKDDEIKSSKGMHTSGTEQMLRRSGREPPSKNKTIPSPASPLKSDRLEKKTPTTPVKRKCDRLEKQKTPSPLRRSLRGNMQPTSNSSEKKTSGNSNGSSENTEKVSKSVKLQEKRPSARSYIQLFSQQKKREDATDPYEQLGRQGKLPKSDDTMVGADVVDNIRTEEFLDIRSKDKALEGIEFVKANQDRPFKIATDDAFNIAAAKDNDISNAEVSHCVCNRDARRDLPSKRQRLEIDLQKHEFCRSGDKTSDPMICETFTPKGRSEVKVTGPRARALNCNINDAKTIDVARAGEGDNISTSKDRLSRHIAYECKSDSSKFAEYWVPVQISEVQVEQYCATLLSNSTSLQSSTKNDVMGALREVLSSVSKCCDHPYLLDVSLQALMIKDLPATEYLDVGIKTSGKLQLLDKMLTEIKKRGLRVLILFQAVGGYGPDSIGSYLDDFVRQRFGPDSYERVDGSGLVPSKKQTAITNFNKESGRFVFLLENRACHASIKLSSLDCVIIFDSDWNPVNDLRALQRITIDSNSTPMKVFRLYSSCTVEEKVLILAKQDANLDSSLHNINCSSSHMLLMWGALNMFRKCEEFDDRSNKTSFSNVNVACGKSLLKDVILEFSAILSEDDQNRDANNRSTILKVQQNEGTYAGNGPLLGELEGQHIEDELPHVFWTKLLEGRQPRWKFLSGLSQRNRKRVHYNDKLSLGPDVEREEVVKKRKKVTRNSISLPSMKRGFQGGKVGAHNEKGTSDNNVSLTFPGSDDYAIGSLQRDHIYSSPRYSNTLPESDAYMGKTEELRKRRDAQKNLLFILKPEILELCEVLQLKEDVNHMVGELLEYIMDNHHVDTESSTILQAFQLSLCWIASSLKEHNIDRKDSLAVAQQHLKFCCKEEEVQCIYSILLKKLRGNGSLTIAGCPINLDTKDTMEVLGPSSSQLQVSQQRVKIEVEDLSMELIPEIRMVEIENPETVKVSEKPPREHILSLLQSQDEEVQELHRTCEEEKAKLDKEYQVELAVVRAIHSHHPSRTDKMKTLEEMYKKKLKEHGLQMEIRLRNLKDTHIVSKNREEGMKATLLEEKKHNTEEVTGGSPEIVASVSSNVSTEQSIHAVVPSILVVGVGKHGITETPSSETSLHSCSRNSIPDKKIDETDSLTSERAMVTGLGHQNKAGKIIDAYECPGYLDLASNQKIHNTNDLLEEGEIPEDCHEGLEDGQANREQNEQSLVSSSSSQPVDQIPAEGLDEAFTLQDGCSDIVTLPGMHNNAAPAVASNLTLQEFEIAELQPTDDAPSANHEVPAAVLSVQSSQQVPVIVPAVETNYEAPRSEPNVLLQTSSCADSPLSPQNFNNQEVSVNETAVLRRSSRSAESPVSCQDHRKLSLPCENDCQGSLTDAPFLPNEPNLHSDCASAQREFTNDPCMIGPAVQLQRSQSIHLSSCFDDPDILPTNRMENLSRNEGNVYNQNSETPTTVLDNFVGHENQTPTQPPTYSLSHDSLINTFGGTPLSHTRTMPISDISNRSIQIAATAPTVRLRMPQMTYSNPLQNESERIRRETEQTIKNHEEAMLRLRSDCEKEIEETVLKIRSKHETLLQDMEARFLLKKQELHAIHKKVYMNKMLAEAFRSKCMDPKVAGKQGLNQQLPQVQSQQCISRHSYSDTPPTVPLSTVRPRNAVQPRPPLPIQSSVDRPTRILQGTTAPSRPSIDVVPSSVVSLAATSKPTAPFIQHVQSSAALFSSPPTRPLQIDNITPPTVNIQVGTIIRAPAPHLQPFRPSISMPPSSVTSPHVSLNQHSPIDSLEKTSQLSSRPLTSLPFPETMGDMRALHDSTVVMLGDIDNRSGAKPTNSVPILTELGSDVIHSDKDLFELGKMPSTQVTSTPAGVTTDIVCLSDDE